MNIHSKFRDYYDHAMGHGKDPLLHYVRNTRVVTGLEFPVKPKIHESYSRAYYYFGYHNPKAKYPNTVEFFFVSFCGKLYPGIRLEIRSSKFLGGSSGAYCYTQDQIDSFLGEHSLSLKSGTQRDINELFRTSTDYERQLLELHRETRSPILLARADHERSFRPAIITADVELQKIGFFRVVDPYTAFQEISMFLGGVLGSPGKEAEPISDELKRDTHGFDDKSFKNVPPGPRKHRRRGR